MPGDANGLNRLAKLYFAGEQKLYFAGEQMAARRPDKQDEGPAIVTCRANQFGDAPATVRGNYLRAGGNVAFGAGRGANILLGGSCKTIALQPLSVERSIGLNLAAGVTSLTSDARGAR
jgi:hypothetical protein